ncbi:MAG: heme o synthase [Bacteroidota bacterium]
MSQKTIHTVDGLRGFIDISKVKLRALIDMLKLRLSLLVALSSVFGYAMAVEGPHSWFMLSMIGIGGLMVTGASNVLNQMIEREYDAQMIRTHQRPLPSGRLNMMEAFLYAAFLAVGGITIIGTFFNLPAALLSIIGLLMYAFVYTPMKRVSPASVFVGAIPGALPPLIGWVAFTGQLDTGGLILFAFQFFWQFPHFWAIAWMLDEDYQKAGFKMLPSVKGKTRFSAAIILAYTLCLIPLAWFPFQIELINLWGTAALLVFGVLFVLPALLLYHTLDKKHAKRLMFGSFLYLPFIQLAFLLG